MSVSGWQTFWLMGGYGIYVWPSLGMCALVMLIEPLLAHRRHARAIKRIEQESGTT